MSATERSPSGDAIAPDDLAVDDRTVLGVLARGEIEPLGLLPRSSNMTFLVRVRDDADEVLGVYKPKAGEAPLWDFPSGTLFLREVAAYVLASALGWPRVPPTVVRDGPHGPGSVQRFLPFDPAEHYFTMHERRRDDFRRLALFDVVANNADRKAGHCLLADDGDLFSVDHGVCFAVEPKLRTVIWDFVGEPIPPELAADLRALLPALAGGRTCERLLELLAPDEVDAIARRLDRLLASGTFPEPGPGRPYPWPPV